MAAPEPAVVQKPWPGNGKAGDVVTWTEMARRIRDGMREPSMRAMAGNILRARGAPGSSRARVQALRDHVEATVLYAPDPPMTEMIQAAKLTLCAEGSNALCIPIGDCDDLTVALASLIGAAGIDVRILALEYGPGVQPHVLLEFQGDDGRWVVCDPSPPAPGGKCPPIGYRPSYKAATIIDPHDPSAVPSSAPGGMFVGVGASAPQALSYTALTLPATAHTGLRHRVGMQVTYTEDPSLNPLVAAIPRAKLLGAGWVIESLEADGPVQIVPGLGQWIQSLILQGIATKEIPLTDDATFQYLVAGVQVASSGSSSTPSTPVSSALATVSTASFARAVLVVLVVGAAVGTGVHYYRQWRAAEASGAGERPRRRARAARGRRR